MAARKSFRTNHSTAAFFLPLFESNDRDLFAQISGEKALGNHRVDAAHDVDDLRHAETDRDAA
jgi:hypothetical protein